MFFTKDLVSSHYLNLLNDLATGVPLRILLVANSINNEQDLKNLFLRLKKPFVSKLRASSVDKLGELWHSNRVKALEMADKAKVENKFRLAVKYYGLIILMSESIDEPMKWSIYQLRDISENTYEIPLKSANSEFFSLINIG